MFPFHSPDEGSIETAEHAPPQDIVNLTDEACSLNPKHHIQTDAFPTKQKQISVKRCDSPSKTRNQTLRSGE